MTPSKILFYLCLSFVAGIFFQSIIKIPQVFLWVFLLLTFLAFVVSLFLRKDNFIIAGFCVLFLLLGILRYQISEFNIANDELRKLNASEGISLIGIISGEPDVRDTYQKIKIKSENSVLLVITSRYPEYKYLDKIKITGNLEAPSETEYFSYKNYLMKDGIYSMMNFPKVELANRDPISIKNRDRVSISASAIYSGILWFKQKLRESIRHNFLPPQSLILEGTILGDNGAMTNDLKNKLNITGLRHVIAVSGTHVVILGSIIMSLLLAFGFWRGQAFYIAIIFICLYIILTGLPASGVRAGIMGGLYLLAQKLGRQSMGSRVIASACAVMLLINPLLLFYDVGFQLSFLAVMGLIYLEPIIKNLLLLGIRFFRKKIFPAMVDDRQSLQEKHGWENFVSIVSTTFAAQIFTLPIMIYNFGNISFVSPITNILIMPVVYWLMVFGFLSSLLGAVSHLLGQIVSVPCWFLLTYFVKVIDIFSKPWAIKTMQNVSWLWLLLSYLLIGLATKFLDKKYSQKISEY